MVTREEHAVLGKNRMASGQEEAFKACAVRFNGNQQGSVLLAVFSDLGPDLLDYLLHCLCQCRHFGWHRMVPFVGLGQSARLPYYGVL